MILLPVLPVPTPTLATLAQANNDPEVVAAMLRFTAAFNYSGQPSLTLPARLRRRRAADRRCS